MEIPPCGDGPPDRRHGATRVRHGRRRATGAPTAPGTGRPRPQAPSPAACHAGSATRAGGRRRGPRAARARDDPREQHGLRRADEGRSSRHAQRRVGRARQDERSGEDGDHQRQVPQGRGLARGGRHSRPADLLRARDRRADAPRPEPREQGGHPRELADRASGPRPGIRLEDEQGDAGAQADRGERRPFPPQSCAVGQRWRNQEPVSRSRNSTRSRPPAVTTSQ
jgi:hypothetical protein